jgi:exopolysaccharide biosynthesis polyprenyl glycosylphosphotransferase
MAQRCDVNRTSLAVVLDVALTLAALYLSSWARLLIPWGVPLAWRHVALPWPVYAMATLIWPVVLSLSSVYEWQPRARRGWGRQAQRLVLGVGLALLVLAGALYLTYRMVPRRQFLYFGLLDLLLLLAARAVARLFRRNGRATRLLIAGAGRVGSEIARQVAEHDGTLQVVGFLDDDPAKAGQTIAGVPVLGTLDALEEVIAAHQVGEVIFALPLRAHDRLMRLVLALEKVPVEVSVVPDYFDLAFFRTRMDELFGFPLIRLRASAIEGGARVVKRLFDLVLGTALLVLLAPLFPLIALAIRLDSPGPVLFRQQRVGENGALFGMWKFRTMVRDAEALTPQVLQRTPDGQLLHKRQDDPRVTRVGRFLRRHSLDELPQLINVLKGEMSLVGPRPELPWMVEHYADWQRKRFAAPPGLTGWWQVSGRSERPMHLHVEDDLYYIQNYSLWLDLRILWRTIGVVISGQGAF